MKKNMLLYCLCSLLILFLFACKEEWQYEFIESLVNNPEQIEEIARQRNIKIGVELEEIIKDKKIFNRYINDFKKLRSIGYKFKVDEIEIHSKSNDSNDNYTIRRIKISSNDNSECMNFYFTNDLYIREILTIGRGDARFDPQDYDERGNCNPD